MAILKIEDFTNIVENITKIIVNILGVIVGVFGINYLKKLRERNKNATFSYYAKLKVRLHSIQEIFFEHKESILSRFVPESVRHERNPAQVEFDDFIVKKFVQEVLETKAFLSNSEDQFPASDTWIAQYDMLLEFLEDCSKLQVDSYYKWANNDRKVKNEYFNRHNNNLIQMICAITKSQQKMQEKIYKNKKKK